MQQQANEISGGLYRHWVVVFINDNQLPHAAEARNPFSCIEGFRKARPELRVGAIIGVSSRAEAESKVRTINATAAEFARYQKFSAETDQQIGQSLVPAATAAGAAAP